jgi:hypothetical protein
MRPRNNLLIVRLQRKLFTLCLSLFLLTGTGFGQTTNGWQINFADYTMAQLHEMGFESYRFQDAADAITTLALKTGSDTAFLKTPYFYLGEEDYFSFSGARLNNAGGNGSIIVSFYLEKYNSPLILIDQITLHDASEETLPDIDFSTQSRGFYRLVITGKYTGNKNNVNLSLKSMTTNLPPQTYTPAEASVAIEVRSNVNTDKKVYTVTDTAQFKYKVLFDGIGEARDVKLVKYNLVIPSGFRVISYVINVIRANAGQSFGEMETMAVKEETIDYDIESGELIVINGNTEDQIEVDMELEAVQPGSYLAQSILEDYDPIITNTDTDDETDPIIIAPDGTLPVELIYFTAEAKGNENRLSWATALELDNDYFSIERSSDGISFKEIGRVNGHGSHSGKIEYQFSDAFNLPQTSYYRLTQVDFDGKSTTFEVKRVVRAAIANSITVFPNPFNGSELNIIANSLRNENMNLQIVDAKGAVVYSQQIMVGDTESLELSGMNLSQGVYTMVIRGNSSNMITKKLMVNR